MQITFLKVGNFQKGTAGIRTSIRFKIQPTIHLAIQLHLYTHTLIPFYLSAFIPLSPYTFLPLYLFTLIPLYPFTYLRIRCAETHRHLKTQSSNSCSTSCQNRNTPCSKANRCRRPRARLCRNDKECWCRTPTYNLHRGYY